MPNALVTGGNGFLGTHVVRRARARGWRVRALCLPGTDPGPLEGGAAEIVWGDVLAPESLAAPMAGVDVVFHVAGSTAEWHRHPERVYETNALGTRNVYEAALAAGVQRLVHTSTVSCVGAGRGTGVPSDEQTLWDLWDTGLYSRSKLLAELEAMRAAARGLDVVVCCPHQILGAGDAGPSTPGRIVLLFARGQIPFYVNARSQFVDVEDVAEGHLLAAERGRRGERYILAGKQVVDMRTFFETCGTLVGRPAPRWELPRRLVWLASYPLEWVADHVTGRPPLLTVGNANLLLDDVTCSIAKAERELGFATGDWREALKKAVRWFQDNGYLPPVPRENV